MTLGLHQSTKRYFSDPLSFLCSPSLCLSVFFLNTNIFLKGMSWSTLLLAVMLKLILIFFFSSLLAHSFIHPLSQLFFWWWIVKQQECFLSSCGLTRNICFQFDRFWNRNSWERNWWLHDGSKISSLQKSSTYSSNLPPTPSHQRSKALSTLLPAALLRFPLLV